MADAFIVRRGGGEDVTTEVNEQTILIEDIMKALDGKVAGSGSNLFDLLSATGYTKMVVDTYTPNSTITVSKNTTTTKIPHSFGKVPSMGLIFSNTPIQSLEDSELMFAVAHDYVDKNYDEQNVSFYLLRVSSDTGGVGGVGGSTMANRFDIDSSNWTLYCGSNIKLKSGTIYTIVTFGSETDNSVISFSINGTTYQATEGMTLAQWAASSYNTDSAYPYDDGTNTYIAMYNDRIISDAEGNPLLSNYRIKNGDNLTFTYM